MLGFLQKLFGKTRDLHPAETGEMESAYEVVPFGLFAFRKSSVAIYELRTDLYSEITDLHIDVRTSADFERAINCLKRLDKDWLDKAIIYIADEEHMAIEDFGGEPEFWVDRDTFIKNIQRHPTLEILVEENECSVTLILNDGGLFGGHYIALDADEFGNFLYVSVNG